MVYMLKSANKTLIILDKIKELFPNARCELNYRNVYELTIAVVLSSQTTDVMVNLVTKQLFSDYPTPNKLAQAKVEDVEMIIKSLGLYHHKAQNIIKLARKIVEEFHGEIPQDYDKLISLPGVGRKTTNVVLSEGFKIPRIAVDTHVERVSKRLEIVNQTSSVLEVEQTLMELIPQPRWHEAHHLLLFFGRYLCLAKNPKCETCFNQSNCSYNKYKNTL